jgi:dTMP kinase
MSGRFVVFEGGEGSGKSTQAERLAATLGAVLTREPGATPVGQQLRALLLDPATGDLSPRTEALLMLADRAEHVAAVVRPALEAGRHVVSDRHTGSTLAYQGGGRGLDEQELRELSAWATAGVVPDLVVLLDVDPGVAARRLGADRDRFEAEGDGFHRRVRQSFLAQAAHEPHRWVVVDGGGPLDEVTARVQAVVAERLAIAAP